MTEYYSEPFEYPSRWTEELQAANVAQYEDLTPQEVVAVVREGYDYIWYSSALFQRGAHDRLFDVYRAFNESPLPSDRAKLTSLPVDLFGTGRREEALELHDRILRDEDDDNRRQANEDLDELIELEVPEHIRNAWQPWGEEDTDGPRGFRAIDLLPEDTDAYGLTRDDLNELMLSQAYAENGDYFSIGRLAVAKIEAKNAQMDAES